MKFFNKNKERERYFKKESRVLYALDSHKAILDIATKPDYDPRTAELMFYVAYYYADLFESETSQWILENILRLRKIVRIIGIRHKDKETYISFLISGSLYELKSVVYNFHFMEECQSNGEQRFFSIIREMLYHTPSTFNRTFIKKGLMREESFLYVNLPNESSDAPIYLTSCGIVDESFIQQQNLKSSEYAGCCTFDLYFDQTKMKKSTFNSLYKDIVFYSLYDKTIIYQDSDRILIRMDGNALLLFLDHLNHPDMDRIGNDKIKYFHSIYESLLLSLKTMGFQIEEKNDTMIYNNEEEISEVLGTYEEEVEIVVEELEE